jgi:hypothetical protein
VYENEYEYVYTEKALWDVLVYENEYEYEYAENAL